MNDDAERVVPVANLQEFFRDSLHGALVRQHLAVEDQTEHYVVNLLTLFARSEALYEGTPGNVRPKRRRPRSAISRCSGSATYRCSSPDSSRAASPRRSSISITTSPWAGVPM